MKKLFLLTKMLLAVALLTVASNAWADGRKRVLYSENFESASTPADVNWSGHSNSNIAISTNASYTTYGKFISGYPGGSGNRAMGGTLSFTSSGYSTSSVTDLGYVIEFDALLKGGQEKNRSQSEFIVTYEKTLSSTGTTYYDESNVGGYLFALSQPTNSTGGFEKTWYINDLGNETTTTATLDYDKFYHYKLVVTKTSVSYTISATGKSDITGSKTINLQTVPVAKQIYMLLGRNAAWFLFDNVEVYDYIPYSVLYAEAKAPYDTKVANLDAAGQAYWAANVTSAASVTDEASYNTAIAALPTTYVTAVKAQVAGGNMTDAVENANCETVEDWGTVTAWSSTSDQFHGNTHSTDVTQISTPFAEAWVWTGENAGAVLADQTISHTAISGLKAGTYRVKGFIRAASEGDHLSETPTGFSLYANDETSATTDGITSSAGLVYGTYSVDVTLDGTEDLTFGVKVKDANCNWVAFKNFTLTYLGADKNTYTINAVAGETTIKEIATGSVWATENYGAYVPKAVLYNGKYYVLDDGDNDNLSNYYASYTMGATNETKDINYTMDKSIVYYIEGENLNTNTASTGLSNGAYGHVSGGSKTTDKGYSIGTFNPGVYQAYAYFVSAEVSKNRGLYVRNKDLGNADGANVLGYASTKAEGLYSTGEFTLTDSTPLSISGYTGTGTYAGKVNQSAEFDYIYIVQTAVAVTFGTNGFTTFASEYPLDLTAATQTAKSFKAYRASEINGTTVTFKDDVDQNVAANTGVLLKGTASTTVYIPVVASGTALANNAFLVNTTDATFTGDSGYTYYGMIKDSDPLTFGTFDPSTVAIPASKAYLKVANGGSAREIRAFFGDDITGISEAKAEAAEKDGKFIINGQLVIKKNGKMFNAAGAQMK